MTEPAPPQSASPALADGLAVEVTQVYADAETAILTVITTSARAATKATDPVAALLDRSAATQTTVRRILDRLDARARRASRSALATAYGRGHGLQRAPVEAAVRAVFDRLAMVRFAIQRWVADVWNRLISAVAAPDPLPAANRLLQREAGRGVTAFDGRSRRNVTSYAGDLVQHAAGNGAIDGFIDRLNDDGDDLVIVTESAHPCPKCDPWEHRVLSTSGGDLRRPSVAEARTAGLFHPRCHHTLFRWHPGFRWPPHSMANRPGTYEATQRQRYIERQVRAWKRREAAALDETTRLAAARKVRAWQAELRRHLAATGLRRSRQRERTDYGHTSPLTHALG